MAVAAPPRRIGVGDSKVSLKATTNVLNALNTNRLSYGPWTRAFEAEFAALHHHTFAAFVNSGTSALQIGLGALKEHYGWKDGDKVFVPALTFVASLNVVIQNGLTPVLVDVDSEFYDMNVYEVPKDKAVAMLPVSLFGQPYNDQLVHIAQVRGLKVLHDSCETMFVGRPYADVTAYSTYVCHLLNTGVGGFAATSDPELAVLIRSLANHGRDGIYASMDDPLGKRETMAARFTFDRLGYSYRATELEAAIGCAELENWVDNVAARRSNAKYLISALSDLPLQLPRERVAGQHAYMMLPIVCADGVDREALTLHLEQWGIETRPLMPLTSQPYVRRLFGPDLDERFSVAARINRQGFYIGAHQHLSTDDLGYINEAFHDFFGGR